MSDQKLASMHPPVASAQINNVIRWALRASKPNRSWLRPERTLLALRAPTNSATERKPLPSQDLMRPCKSSFNGVGIL